MSARSTLYSSLKTDLEAITGIKKVGLWNNQLEREDEENAFLYPAIFIEFVPGAFKDLANKATVQQYDLNIRLHVCFESYRDADTGILDLIDSVWQKVHGKQYGDFGKLSRISEIQNFDHPNVQDYIQEYKTLGRDIKTSTLVEATLTPVVTPVVIDITES